MGATADNGAGEWPAGGSVMRVQNRSDYPDDEVLRLVAFGATGVNTIGVAFHIGNHWRGPLSGRASQGVPMCPSPPPLATVEYSVTIKLGRPDQFPVTSLTVKRRWLPDGTTHDEALATAARLGGEVMSEWSRDRGDSYAVVVKQPYGGKRAPLIEYRDWREGLVGLAAHEARHIHQFRHNKPHSEIDCQRFAAAALKRFRAVQATA